MTDRHQAELEKQALEQQLRQSEKLRSIGELAGGIAHDFNNQLSGILGYVDLLRLERGDDPRLVEYANNIAAPAKRAADLTAKLLAFARKGQFQPEPLDVHAVIREAVSVLQRSIAKTIHLRLELEATRSVVVGDATQLQNALLNIALNARDAMPEGGELIIRTELRRVSAAAVPTGADVAEPRLLILLSDTGMGMSEETQQRVFEPFFTTKPLGQGTGMGLAAVHGIVRKHGGGVKVDSALGRGTTFSITLPLAPEDTVAARRSGQYPAVRGAGRVLVVDDEDIVCSMVARMLRRLGYDPLTREVARDAIRLYRDQWRTIDLVLLDLVLPKMSGKRVFEAIRAVNPQARVILVSGYSAEGEARELLDAGALGFLQKPFTATQLSQSVADALSVELAPPVQRRVPLRSGAVPAQPDVPFDSDAATASDRRR